MTQRVHVGRGEGLRDSSRSSAAVISHAVAMRTMRPRAALMRQRKSEDIRGKLGAPSDNWHTQTAGDVWA